MKGQQTGLCQPLPKGYNHAFYDFVVFISPQNPIEIYWWNMSSLRPWLCRIWPANFSWPQPKNGGSAEPRHKLLWIQLIRRNCCRVDHDNTMSLCHLDNLESLTNLDNLTKVNKCLFLPLRSCSLCAAGIGETGLTGLFYQFLAWSESDFIAVLDGCLNSKLPDCQVESCLYWSTPC